MRQYLKEFYKVRAHTLNKHFLVGKYLAKAVR